MLGAKDPIRKVRSRVLYYFSPDLFHYTLRANAIHVYIVRSGSVVVLEQGARIRLRVKPAS